MITLKMEGLEGVKEAIRELGPKLSGRALRAAARKSFAPVLERARQLAPVDTGLLRESIVLESRVGKGGTSADAVVVVGLRIRAVRGAAKLGRKTKSAHWRWHFPELGTAKQAARPFLRPALDENAQQVVDEFTRMARKQLEAALRKRAKGTTR